MGTHRTDNDREWRTERSGPPGGYDRENWRGTLGSDATPRLADYPQHERSSRDPRWIPEDRDELRYAEDRQRFQDDRQRFQDDRQRFGDDRQRLVRRDERWRDDRWNEMRDDERRFGAEDIYGDYDRGDQLYGRRSEMWGNNDRTRYGGRYSQGSSFRGQSYNPPSYARTDPMRGGWDGYGGHISGGNPRGNPSNARETTGYGYGGRMELSGGWSGGAPYANRGHRGKGPIGYQRSDERIKEEVSQALADDDDIDASEIEVQVKGGEVTLRGHVPDRRTKRAAEDCVEHLSGVKEVSNQLRVQLDAKGDKNSKEFMTTTEKEPDPSRRARA